MDPIIKTDQNYQGNGAQLIEDGYSFEEAVDMMKKKDFKKAKKYSKEISLEQRKEEKKEDIISFSLTAKETKLYMDWLDGLWKGVELDDTEDSYTLHPTLQFSPYVMGTMITAIEGNRKIVLRTAWEDDEIERE